LTTGRAPGSESIAAQNVARLVEMSWRDPIALSAQLPLCTCNAEDFAGLAGLVEIVSVVTARS
jgi:hypothetical protein